MIHEILVIFQIVVCVALIGLILIQHGRGADVGAAFGSGASGTVFGAQGSASFLTRITAVLATLFFINSMTLAYFVGQRLEKSSVMEKMQPQVPAPKPSEVPSVPSPNPSDLPPVTAPPGQTSGTPTPPASGTGNPSEVPSVPSANPSDLPPVTAPSGPTSGTPTAPASTEVPPPPVATPPASMDVPPPLAAPETPAPASTPAPTDTAPAPSPATPNP